MNQPLLVTRVSILLTGAVLLSGCGAGIVPPSQVRGAPAIATAAPATTAPAVAGVAEPELIAGIPIITATLETRAVLDMDADKLEISQKDARLGDADDPAIWLHPTDAAQSLVVTVLKNGGLEVYDLDGQVVQSLQPEGARYNNVDLVYGFALGSQTADVLVATDRYQDRLAIFQVNPQTRQLEDITDPAGKLIFTPEGQPSDETTTAYGIALWHDASADATYAFVTRRATGEIAQLQLVGNQGKVNWNLVRTLTLPTPENGELEDAQCEGMVVDSETGTLYIGQENVGVWKVSAKLEDTAAPQLIHAVAPAGQHLEADVEGLTLYYAAEGKGYLLVSSQGNNTFAVFTREGNNTYLGSFQIGPSNGPMSLTSPIDGVQESDGAMVLNVPLGPRFPQGLLVVQDGFNLPAVMVEDEGELENVSTSFKFIPWERVAAAFATPLMIDTASYAPR